MQDALRAAFCWRTPDEEAEAIAALFPGGLPSSPAPRRPAPQFGAAFAGTSAAGGARASPFAGFGIGAGLTAVPAPLRSPFAFASAPETGQPARPGAPGAQQAAAGPAAGPAPASLLGMRAADAAAAAAAAAAEAAAAAASGSTGTPAGSLQRGPSRAVAAEAEAAAAAAAALLAEAEAAQPQARRGRKPKEGLVPTREYQAVRNFRERQKNAKESLEAEVRQKLEQMRLLLAENEALHTRQKVLQTVIAANGGAPPPGGEHAPDAAAGDDADSGPARALSCGPPAPSGASSSSAASGGAVPPADSPEASALWALVPAWATRYRAYLEHFKAHRTLPGGRTLPLQDGDPRMAEFLELAAFPTSLSVPDQYALLATNLETMRPEPHDQGMHARVARQMRLTPELDAQILAAWKVFERGLSRLKRERAALISRLAAVQSHLEGLPVDTPGFDEYELAHTIEPGIGSMLQTASLEELLGGLEDNMLRENQQWEITTRSINTLLGEEGVTHMCVLAWPYLPSSTQVFAVYVTEVLGHKPEAAP